jgi:Domain of unknown function (DUF4189)
LTRLKVLLAVMLAISFGVCSVGRAQAAEKWGAIAMGNNMEFGWMTDAPDSTTARNIALRNCNQNTNGANDCRVEVDFSAHRCAAIVQTPSRDGYNWGRGNTPAEAENDAMRKMSQVGPVLVSKCNSASGPAFVAEPFRVQAQFVGNDASPIVLYSSSIESRTDRTFHQCLSWRNISNKDVAAIKVDLRFYDDFHAQLQSFEVTKSGKYSPGINIDDICWTYALNWTAQQIRQMRVEKITVASVRFSDDAIWTPGVAWTKTFSTSGTPLAAPQTIAAGATGAAPGAGAGTGSPTGPAGAAGPVNVGDAVGGGGSFGASGSAFGAIAMQPNTRIVGVSTDARNEDASVYEALSKCNQQSAGANNCVIMLKFSGTSKCAAVAVDGIRFGTGKGPELNNAIATALANLRANGGNIGNNIVASPCNSR